MDGKFPANFEKLTGELFFCQWFFCRLSINACAFLDDYWGLFRPSRNCRQLSFPSRISHFEIPG